ncbi:DUF2064 domain-containing protein [Aquimarina sp. AU119]|uniref:TIGR04282 family arsenosugar biosynthesis glycosyltransferase n=1 Tax=Aquimarina sp. AU119 TaxID=2108528 RepID=UPI0013576A12|nr:DUF2064 domain-containing protein [Aquimarina sp. AU119]
MIDQHEQIAVLIFANSSEEELKHKCIPKGKGLFNYFNSQTLKKVRKTNLPFFLYSEKDQLGNNFAERFANAIEDLFNKGYEKIITLGNDSPNLEVSHIIEASKKLSHNDAVIGPSMDGGVYLMGLHRKSFNKLQFLELPWQTNTLAKTFINKILKLGLTVHFLKYLKDIDNLKDLKQFLRDIRNLSSIFKNILLTIFKTSFQEIRFQDVFISKVVTTLHFNKGSPSLI